MIWLNFWAQYWNCVFAVTPPPNKPTAEVIVLSSRRRARK